MAKTNKEETKAGSATASSLNPDLGVGTGASHAGGGGIGMETAPKSAGTITITPEQLNAFINEAVDKRMGTKIEKPKRVTEHTATLRYFEDKAVFEIKNLKERVIDGRRVGFITLVLSDGSEVETEYLPFLNDGERVQVKILEQKAKEHVISHGTVRAVNPDPYNQKSWSGGMIDLEVTSYTYEVKVQVLTDGPHQNETYTVTTKALNI